MSVTDFNAGVVTQVNVTGGSNRSDRVDQLQERQRAGVEGLHVLEIGVRAILEQRQLRARDPLVRTRPAAAWPSEAGAAKAV